MIESSRSFLFTEYARSICGTFKNQGTDPKVWDVLPVWFQFSNFSSFPICPGNQVLIIYLNLQDKFSSYPNIKEILAQVKADKAAQRARLDTYYDDERLAQLAAQGVVKSKDTSVVTGTNGSTTNGTTNDTTLGHINEQTNGHAVAAA